MQVSKLEEMICLSLIYFVNLSGLDGEDSNFPAASQEKNLKELMEHEPGNKLCMLFLLNTIQQYIIPT